MVFLLGVLILHCRPILTIRTAKIVSTHGYHSVLVLSLLRGLLQEGVASRAPAPAEMILAIEDNEAEALQITATGMPAKVQEIQKPVDMPFTTSPPAKAALQEDTNFQKSSGGHDSLVQKRIQPGVLEDPLLSDDGCECITPCVTDPVSPDDSIYGWKYCKIAPGPCHSGYECKEPDYCVRPCGHPLNLTIYNHILRLERNQTKKNQNKNPSSTGHTECDDCGRLSFRYLKAQRFADIAITIFLTVAAVLLICNCFIYCIASKLHEDLCRYVARYVAPEPACQMCHQEFTSGDVDQ